MSPATPFRTLLVAPLIGIILNATAAPAAAPVSFDTTPRAGQHQRQTMDLQATIAMRVEAGPEATDAQRAKAIQAADQMALVGPLKMSMQMLQTLQVGQPDRDGWLPMTVASGVKRAEMVVAGKASPLPNMKGKDIAFSARFNPQDFGLEIVSVEGAPQLDEALRGQGVKLIGDALQLLKALRERPLKVGDSVQVPLSMTLPISLPGGAGAMDGQLRYTLARVDRGVAYFDLGMDLNLAFDVPSPAAAASAPAGDAASAPPADTAPKIAHMRMTGSGKGTSALRLSDRLPLASRLAMDLQMTIDVPDNQRMLMDMGMVLQAKGEALAKPAMKAPAGKKKP